MKHELTPKVEMAAKVPEGFSIADSAMRVIRSLVARPHHVAYVCWATETDRATGEKRFEGWSVVSFEKRECDEPVEISGVRFLFDPSRADELVGKTLYWIDGQGFRVIQERVWKIPRGAA